MNLSKVISLLVVALACHGCGSEPDDSRVVGQLSSDRMELAAEFNEPIVAVLVDEGVVVSAGDVLMQQDDSRARARFAEAEAALDQAQARLDELVRGPRREQIDAARADRDGAERDYEFRTVQAARARDLEAKQLASPENLDRAIADLDAARALLDQRSARLEELLAGTTLEELAQAESAVHQAEARRDSAQIDVQRHSIRAPADGITDARLFELGERPTPGQPVMILLGGDQPFAQIFVPEALRARVTAGLPVRVYVDGLDNGIDGRVRWISSEAAFTPYFALTERDRGRLTFLAKVDLEGVRERLPDGVPVEVELGLDLGTP